MYQIISLDTSAAGYGNRGVICPVFLVSELADLAEDSLIINSPGFYVLATDVSVGAKDPDSNQWILPAATPILITTQPSNATVKQGAVSGTIGVVAYARDSAGSYTPTYQWYSCADTARTNPSAVGGQTTANLTIPTGVLEASSPYYYYCTITANSKTLNSSVATVTVTAAA